MFNANKLRGKIVENGLSVPEVASALGMDKSTFYRRLDDKEGSFTVKEVSLLSKLLKLSVEELNSIFFAEIVA
ncbi:MAG: XRE family transcriptional regulator [Peptococcaceae bacterium]|nr:XRE family transcriptional regulator [Peptococcaceae bacterium]